MTTLALVATLLLSGCQQGTPMNAGTKTTTIIQQESPKGGQNTQVQPAPVQQEEGKTGGGQEKSGQASGSAQEKSQEPRFVPERVFQLNKLEKATVKVGKHVFHLWVMDSDAKRREGMMFLKDSDFKEDEGMIFVFLGEDYRRFWMRNTLVDLDVCYCDKTGRILNTYTMKALDEETDYSSKGSAMYVIELKAGILKKLGITAGMRFVIPEDVVSRDDGN